MSDVMGKKATIESIGFGGSGVFKQDDGKTCFVPFTAPGDEITYTITEEKKTFNRAKVKKIIEKGPSRVEPKCPYFGTCGGCQLQHIDYDEQLKTKKQFVIDAFERIAKLKVPSIEITPSKECYAYRKHIRLNLRKEGKGFVAGYIGSEGFLPVTQCPIFSDKPLPIDFLSYLSNEGVKEGSLRIFKTGESDYLLALSTFPILPKNHAEFLYAHPIVMQCPRKRESYGKIDPQVDIAGIKFAFSPFGFLQSNEGLLPHFYKAIVDRVGPKETRVLDLYCGVGITTAILSRLGYEVMGIDSNPEAVRCARKNAPAKRILAAKTELVLPPILDKLQPDAIIINPPREGLSKRTMEALIDYGAKKLIYSSCMPATQARDLVLLTRAGYEVESCHGFDLFPQTTHLETIVSLKKSSQ